VKEATQYVPLQKLGVCNQCGFGTTKHGNSTTHEAQWGKVGLLGTLGKKIWGDK
jgi:methionine synthase II (cobalamin-independent)